MFPPWFKNSPIMEKTRRDLALEDYENAQRAKYEAAKAVDPVVQELDSIKEAYQLLRKLEAPARVRVWKYLAELLPVND